mgnify:CR=1 FL=1
MEAPHCHQDGQFMKYVGRQLGLGFAASYPIGRFRCSKGHEELLVLPWDFRG